MADDVTPEEPERFGPYRVLERIGEGGMSVVYIALRERDPKPQIVKVLHEAMARNDVVTQRFLREAQIASSLHHPRIVPVTGAGKEDGRFYLAMEYLKSVELEQIFHACLRAKRPIPPEITLTLAQDVLDALHYAHDYRDPEGRHLGIVHRDLSPRNVLVGTDGYARLIDFGLARTNLGSFRTQPGMVMGTLRYMSPEQAVAEPVDHRSDLYTFGVVLYELLTNSLVVPDVAAKDILRIVVTDTPEPASARNPKLRRSLDVVLRRALEKERTKRYENAETFARALEHASGAWARCPRDEIARFARSVLPQQVAEAEARFGRAVAQTTPLPPSAEDAPEFEATRAAPLGAFIDEPSPAPAAHAVRLDESPTPPVDARSRRRRRWERAAGVLAVMVLFLTGILATREGARIDPDAHPTRPSTPTTRSTPTRRAAPSAGTSPKAAPWASGAPEPVPRSPASPPPQEPARAKAVVKRRLPSKPERSAKAVVPKGEPPRARSEESAGREAGRLASWLTTIGARTLDPVTEGPRFERRVDRLIRALDDPETQARKKERLELLLGTDPTAESLVPYVQGLRAELVAEATR